MAVSVISLIYQNLLFAEGLESILLQNNFKVIKKEIFELKGMINNQLSNADLTIVEVSWPFSHLENTVDQIITLIKVNTKIILVSNIINKNIFHMVNDNKINGIVLKSDGKDEFLFGLKQVLEDKTYYSSLVANLLVRHKNETETFTVSKREKQILNLIAEMNSTEEIANKLFITKSTVKTHRRNLMRKFNSKNTLCLLRSACRENLLNTENNFCGCCFKQYIEI